MGLDLIPWPITLLLGTVSFILLIGYAVKSLKLYRKHFIIGIFMLGLASISEVIVTILNISALYKHWVIYFKTVSIVLVILGSLFIVINYYLGIKTGKAQKKKFWILFSMTIILIILCIGGAVYLASK